MRKRVMRRRGRKSRRSGGGLALKAYRLAKRTALTCKPELKYQDYFNEDFTPAINSWDVVLAPFSGIIPGTPDKGSRIGDQIYAQRLSFTIRMKLPDASLTTLPFASLRFVLIRLKNQPSLSIADTQIFAQDSITSYLTWDQRYNVTKLWDKTFTLTAGGVSERTIKVTKKIRSRVQYINDGQAVTKNQLILYCIGDETSLDSTTSISKLVSARVTYTDA